LIDETRSIIIINESMNVNFESNYERRAFPKMFCYFELWSGTSKFRYNMPFATRGEDIFEELLQPKSPSLYYKYHNVSNAIELIAKKSPKGSTRHVFIEYCASWDDNYDEYDMNTIVEIILSANNHGIQFILFMRGYDVQNIRETIYDCYQGGLLKNCDFYHAL